MGLWQGHVGKPRAEAEDKHRGLKAQFCLEDGFGEILMDSGIVGRAVTGLAFNRPEFQDQFGKIETLRAAAFCPQFAEQAVVKAGLTAQLGEFVLIDELWHGAKASHPAGGQGIRFFMVRSFRFGTLRKPTLQGKHSE